MYLQWNPKNKVTKKYIIIIKLNDKIFKIQSQGYKTQFIMTEINVGKVLIMI